MLPVIDQSPPDGAAGVTFVELMVTIAIMAIITLPLLSLFGAAYAGIIQAGHKTAAVNLCREKLEEAKNNGYSYYRYHEATVAEEETFSCTEYENNGSIAGYPSFSRITVITGGPRLLPGGLIVDILRVTVTVSWREGEAEKRTTLAGEISDSP